MLNVVQAQTSDAIPGCNEIQTFFEQTTELIKDRIAMQASDRDIEIFRQSFNTLALSYLGQNPIMLQFWEWIPTAKSMRNGSKRC